MDEAVEWAHDEWNWRGSDSDHKHARARAALEAAPEDPIVLWRCLDHWGYFGMPVAEGWSSAGPERPEGVPLLASVLERAETSLLRPDRPDTVDERCLTFFTKLQRALSIISGDRPTAADLERASQLLDEMFAVVDLPELGDEQKYYDHQLSIWASVRRRAWQALEIGPPYPDWLREKLGNCLGYTDWAWGWPISPLTRDPMFRSWATDQLAERTRTGTHPEAYRNDGNPLVINAENLVERDRPSAEETEGRHLLALWFGADRESMTHHLRSLIEDPRDRWQPHGRDSIVRAVERALGLGVAPEPGVLVEAIEAKLPGIVRAMVAGGVPVDRKAKTAATKSKHKATIAALEGAASEGNGKRKIDGAALAAASAKLGEELRAAAAKIEPGELTFIGGLFGRDAASAVGIIDKVMAKQPSSPEEALETGAGFVFDDYVLCRALNIAGYKIDVRRKGGEVEQILTSGDLIVDGALIDKLGGGWIAVGGDLICDALITEADVIVGGKLAAKTIVWGNYNDGTLCVNGTVECPRIAMTDHTFECRGDEGIEYLSDDEAEALFVPAMLDDGSLERGRVIKAIKANKQYLVGVAAAKATAKPKSKPAAKAKPAKTKAKPKPAAKAQAKAKVKTKAKTKKKKR